MKENEKIDQYMARLNSLIPNEHNITISRYKSLEYSLPAWSISVWDQTYKEIFTYRNGDSDLRKFLRSLVNILEYKEKK